MEANLIKKGLQQITTSRLNTIHIEYKVDCVTSNVHELHKQLKKAIDSKRTMVVKGKREVEPAEVVDMFNAVDNAVKFYKVKYNRKTFPRDINLFELIDDLNELNPAQIIRQVLNMNGNVTKNVKSNKKSKIDFDKLIDEEMKLGLF